MNKFENGKIYKIVDNTSDMIYVGSTYKKLEQRLKQHQANYKSFKSGIYPNYVTVFKILENEDYTIQLIKSYPCENRQQLNIHEGLIIKQLRNNGSNVINKNIAGQTIKESQAQYRQNNRQKIKDYKNQKHYCQCGGKYSNAHKAKHGRTKRHCEFINKGKTINNTGNTYNITINVNSTKQLEHLDFLKDIK